MSKPEIVEKSSVSLSELKSELQAIQKRDSELNFRAGKTFEYVSALNPVSKSVFDKLKSEISALEIPRLKEDHVVKIIDMMPQTVNELNVILQGYTITVSKENMAKIVNVVKEASSKKK